MSLNQLLSSDFSEYYRRPQNRLQKRNVKFPNPTLISEGVGMVQHKT